jgi:hypothetical protein
MVESMRRYELDWDVLLQLGMYWRGQRTTEVDAGKKLEKIKFKCRTPGLRDLPLEECIPPLDI